MSNITWVDNKFYETKWLHLAEILQDFSKNTQELWLAEIPSKDRITPEDKQYPYAIMSYDKNGAEYTVMLVHEQAHPEQVLAKLWEADSRSGNQLDKMRARNAAAKAFEMKDKLDEIEERKDKAKWLATAGKNWRTYRNSHGELVKLNEINEQTPIRKHH